MTAASTSLSLLPMSTPNTLPSTLWARQEQVRLSGLVNQALENLQELQRSIQQLGKELDSEEAVGLLTRLRDNHSIYDITTSATELLNISKVAIPAVRSIEAGSSKPEAKKALKNTLDSVFYPIIGISVSGFGAEPKCIPQFKDLMPKNYAYVFEYLSFINTHPLFNPTEWALRVSRSLVSNQSQDLNAMDANLSSVSEGLKQLYAYYRLPFMTEANGAGSEGCFKALTDLLQSTYQTFMIPPPQESFKKALAENYQQVLLRYPAGTFKPIGNFVDYVLDIAEQTRRASYRFLCSLYRGVQSEIDKALSTADKTERIQPLQFAMDFLNPKERYSQCSSALESRCCYPTQTLNQNYQKSVIITLLGGGAISSATLSIAPNIHPWLIEHNGNVERVVRASAVTLTELPSDVINTVLIPYISYVPPVQQPVASTAQQ